MTHEVNLPELGENIETVGVATVLVSEGDTVRKDQPIVEVETEKASLEVPSTVAGTVREVRVSAGDQIKIGSVLITVEEQAEGGEAEVPEAGEVTEREADEGKERDEVAEPETEESRAPVEVETTAGEAAAGEPRESEEREPTAPAELPPLRTTDIGDVAPAAPSVRRLARQLGLDIRRVDGTGRGGRISMDDVKASAKRVIEGAAAGPGFGLGVGGHPELPDFSAFGETVREPMTSVRKATAAAMARAWETVPHVTQHDRADITELEALRKRYGARVERAGGKLTVTAIALKVVATALGVFPKFNASIDIGSQEIVFKKYVHLGVAVDTDRGLLVPVVRDVDRKNVTELAVELGELAARARDKKIMPDELHGACFTVSNLGGLGTTYFSPIVNWPEVAILGIGRAERRPRFVDDRVEPRLILPLSVSYDHRLIDGADAARFLRWVAEALEQPLLLALEG